MARVKYVSNTELAETQPALNERLLKERKVPTGNIFLALANAPAILGDFLTYANAVRAADLSPKLREMAILTVGYCTNSEYEVKHHHSHGLKAGLTEAQFHAIAHFETSDLFDEQEKAVMAFAKESTLNVDVSDDVWNGVAKFLSEKQLVELSINVAWYNSGVRLMGALKIDLEEGYR
ncbi:carboxymuconolactone decarboxylase protein [Rhizobium phaseoli]|uniref:Carboxymuconolactone decarboxylase family protein n=2 Tax=Rhizobium TaxID=379 RepID=A0A192T913_9HYPH|nr:MULTISPECIES: carboxymuconolactone decarboxylase family protein [Rhizobium]ACE91277.1 putative carboxymuconolactone decarboxylase protein [Rhizobium etli CIAT 652]ANL28085.1 carboxymuconolactone decarboxylase protein [Rhizobium phaseoli]ANL40703.1 carboxymuconolactone decarboxylase protein [Rhizobium phaseoli]ANL53438.1 carboxymuconolactone decarboxylase protein [Rhizobium phaseoli]ANL59691.1 carboxymuconolactone decarboxylase protein [Rhizobium phaseoli]